MHSPTKIKWEERKSSNFCCSEKEMERILDSQTNYMDCTGNLSRSQITGEVSKVLSSPLFKSELLGANLVPISGFFGGDKRSYIIILGSISPLHY